MPGSSVGQQTSDSNKYQKSNFNKSYLNIKFYFKQNKLDLIKKHNFVKIKLCLKQKPYIKTIINNHINTDRVNNCQVRSG